MICKSYLLKTLNQLDRLYNSSKARQKTIFYSKLAVIELCGWIEETMDEIILRCANKCLKEQQSQKLIKNTVKTNYSFQYDNFRKILMMIIGLVNLEKIEKKLNTTEKVTKLKTKLDSLKNSRNQAAHTHVKGILRTYDAPSKVKNDFLEIYDLLKDFDDELRQQKI